MLPEFCCWNDHKIVINDYIPSPWQPAVPWGSGHLPVLSCWAFQVHSHCGSQGFVLPQTCDPFWLGSHWWWYLAFQIFHIPDFSPFLALETKNILRIVAIVFIKPVWRGGAGTQIFNWFTAQQQWEGGGRTTAYWNLKYQKNPFVPGCFEIRSSEFVLRLKWIF